MTSFVCHCSENSVKFIQ